MIKFLLLTLPALAGDSGHHAADAHHSIPWGAIGVQAFNFGLLLLVLGFLLAKSIKAMFANRASEYTTLVERADAARRQAESGRQEIEARLAKLEASAEQGLVQAKADAEQLRKRMLNEAKVLSDKLEHEAKRTVGVELEKAKAELRRDLLGQALSSSRENLKTKLGSSEQKRLQNEFVEKIQVVTS